VENNLIVQESGALTIHNLLAEGFMLEQLQEVKANREFQVLDIGRFLPVLKIFNIVDEARILHIASLRQEM